MSGQFNIHGNHVEVTPALHSYARSKIGKVSKIVDNITTINVILSIDKLDHKAEAEVKIGGDHNPIFADAVSDDLYKSIDQLENKLIVQVKKYADKLHQHRNTQKKSDNENQD